MAAGPTALFTGDQYPRCPGGRRCAQR